MVIDWQEDRHDDHHQWEEDDNHSPDEANQEVPEGQGMEGSAYVLGIGRISTHRLLTHPVRI